MSEDEEYKVGRGKPPLQTRFQKGQSGNPKGRKRGRISLANIVLDAMYEKVTVSQGGRQTSIPKIQAAVKQAVNQAANGNLASVRLVLDIAGQAEAQLAAQAPERRTTEERRASDLEILRALQVRLDESDDG